MFGCILLHPAVCGLLSDFEAIICGAVIVDGLSGVSNCMVIYCCILQFVGCFYTSKLCLLHSIYKAVIIKGLAGVVCYHVETCGVLRAVMTTLKLATFFAR